MLSGRRFRLERATLAVETLDGKRGAVTVPAGTILTVASGPVNGDGILEVLFEGRMVSMFGVDLDVPGTEVTEEIATA